MRGKKIDNVSLNFEPSQGSRIKDYIPTTYVSLHLFSNKIFEELEKNNFSGFRKVPINLKDGNSNNIEGYSLLTVTGKCGKTFKDEKTIQTLPPITEFGKAMDHYIGIFFDVDTWDGSDFFMPEETGFIFFTERVKEVLLKLNISNLTITNIKDIETIVS
ncbi:MAG: hypothetical protein RLN81_00190 [Balneolaceae bacterium]